MKMKAEDCKISTDRKLELMKTVRMQNQYNRNQCRERERLLYGMAGGKSELFASQSCGIALSPHVQADADSMPLFQNHFLSGFRLRFVLSMLLFGLFIWADVQQITFLEQTTQTLFSLLQHSFDIPKAIQSFNFIDL